ncbi:MAG: aryl-sulfate sulfotransferase [Chitinophagales bacterium]|nr:aryl-sulfate sulfotransferase [Chitinophagales bacterium]
MMKVSSIFLSIWLLSPTAIAQFAYISPEPSSRHHFPETNIILKNGDLIDDKSLDGKKLLTITGSLSGEHSWMAQLSDDNKTIIIKPQPAFVYSETVSVTVHSGIKKTSKEKIQGVSFTFYIKPESTPQEQVRFLQANHDRLAEESFHTINLKSQANKIPLPATTIYPLDSMPAFKININNNPASGQIFYCNHEDQDVLGHVGTNSFLTIIKNNGNIVWARDVGSNGRDFKINVSGYLTYFVDDRAIWMVMDSNYNIIDSVQCGNGLEKSTNNHEFMMYPDGHSFVFAYDNETTDLTAYGGLPDAVVQYPVIQELDASHNVIFEWRTMDHFKITDADQYVSLTNATVDFAHTNSLERDADGNLWISNRNMDELTKINHKTGAIIWRMNGENNQFTFVNDNIPEHFSNQHDLRLLGNGHITLFNNGNHLDPLISSAKEYMVDEKKKKVTLIWYYEHPDVNGNHVFGSATGNAQRLPNGNTMIDWGLIPLNEGMPNQTEVDSNKVIRWEMTFDSAGEKCYRVHKYVWNPCSRITGYTMDAVPKEKNASLSWGEATGGAKYRVNYRVKGTTSWIKAGNTANTTMTIRNLTPATKYEWQVLTLCDNNETSNYSSISRFTTLAAKNILTDLIINGQLIADVYPNPAGQKLNIAINEPGDNQLSVEIRNIFGVIVKHSDFNTDNGHQLIAIAVDALTSGIYIAEIHCNSKTVVKTFLKQ